MTRKKSGGRIKQGGRNKSGGRKQPALGEHGQGKGPDYKEQDKATWKKQSYREYSDMSDMVDKLQTIRHLMTKEENQLLYDIEDGFWSEDVGTHFVEQDIDDLKKRVERRMATHLDMILAEAKVDKELGDLRHDWARMTDEMRMAEAWPEHMRSPSAEKDIEKSSHKIKIDIEPRVKELHQYKRLYQRARAIRDRGLDNLDRGVMEALLQLEEALRGEHGMPEDLDMAMKEIEKAVGIGMSENEARDLQGPLSFNTREARDKLAVIEDIFNEDVYGIDVSHLQVFEVMGAPKAKKKFVVRCIADIARPDDEMPAHLAQVMKREFRDGEFWEPVVEYKDGEPFFDWEFTIYGYV